MEKLTDRQKQVYLIIKDYISEKGYSPTMRELCKLCYTTSTASIHDMLDRLKKKGYIDYQKNLPRTIVIKENQNGTRRITKETII